MRLPLRRVGAIAQIPFLMLILTASSPFDRVVGVFSPQGGASLAKRLPVDGMRVTRIEFLSNDPTTVFPRVEVRDGGTREGGQGRLLVEFVDVVPSALGGHLCSLSIPSRLVEGVEELLVVVGMPAAIGAHVIGAGPGIAASETNTCRTSYLRSDASGELEMLDADLAIWLVPESAGGMKVTLPARHDDLKLTVLTAPRRGVVDISVTVEAGSPGLVEIYDVRGRHVVELWRGNWIAGENKLQWDGKNSAKQDLPHGVFLVVVQSVTAVRTAKVLRVR